MPCTPLHMASIRSRSMIGWPSAEFVDVPNRRPSAKQANAGSASSFTSRYRMVMRLRLSARTT